MGQAHAGWVLPVVTLDINCPPAVRCIACCYVGVANCTVISHLPSIAVQRRLRRHQPVPLWIDLPVA